MHHKTSLAALLIATTLGATVQCAPSWAAMAEKAKLDKAAADVGAGKYKEGAAEFKALAEQGCPFAQCIMGVMYQNGRGVPKDIHQAVNWYSKSAAQGFASAEEHLGEIFRDGTDGIRKDNKIATNWFRRAAFHGNGKAQLAIGKMYIASHTPGEQTEGRIWLAKACQVPGNIADEAHKLFMQLPGMQDYVKAQNDFQFAIANIAVGGTLSRMSEKVPSKSSSDLLANVPDKDKGKLSAADINNLSDKVSDKLGDKQGSKLSSEEISKLSDKVSQNLGDKDRVKLVPPANMPTAFSEKWSGFNDLEKSLSPSGLTQ